MSRNKSVFREYYEAILVAFILALFVRTFVFENFKIPSGSMEDNLLVGDHLVVNKFIYGEHASTFVHRLLGYRSPRRGDVVVFKFPNQPRRDFIKRCVAVAGDTVAVRDGVLYVNGDIYESNFGDPDGDHSCIPSWVDPESCSEPRAKKDQAAYVRSGASGPNRRWPRDPDSAPNGEPEGHNLMMGDNPNKKDRKSTRQKNKNPRISYDI